jgi:hypothetical protein
MHLDLSTLRFLCEDPGACPDYGDTPVQIRRAPESGVLPVVQATCTVTTGSGMGFNNNILLNVPPTTKSYANCHHQNRFGALLKHDLSMNAKK